MRRLIYLNHNYTISCKVLLKKNGSYYGNYFPYHHTHSIILWYHLVKMTIWINISGHQWVHLSLGALLHCIPARLKCSTLYIQMWHWRFICWVLQRSAYDRGSVCGRQRADWSDLRFSLFLHHQMFIPFSVTDSGMQAVVCAFCPYVALQSTGPDWVRLRLIDCTELSVTGPGRGENTGQRRRRYAFWWCHCETNNKTGIERDR